VDPGSAAHHCLGRSGNLAFSPLQHFDIPKAMKNDASEGQGPTCRPASPRSNNRPGVQKAGLGAQLRGAGICGRCRFRRARNQALRALALERPRHSKEGRRTRRVRAGRRAQCPSPPEPGAEPEPVPYAPSPWAERTGRRKLAQARTLLGAVQTWGLAENRVA